MAIGEKKAILRGIHESADAAAQERQQQVPDAAASRRAARSAELPMRLFIVLVLTLAVLISAGTASFILYGHYRAGLALEPVTSRIDDYIKDAAKLVGVMVFLGLLGTGVLVVFHEALSRRAKWMGGIVLGLLVPIAIVAVPLMPVLYNKGRGEAFATFDLPQLEADTAMIRAQYKLPDTRARYISSYDPEWANLPPYVRDTLKPTQVTIYSKGILYQFAGSFGDVDGILVMPIPPGEARGFAERNGIKILRGDPPMFRLDGAYVPEEVHPATVPTSFPHGGPWGYRDTPVPWAEP